MVGAGVAAMVLCGNVGGLNQEVRPTLQADSASVAPSSPVYIARPYGIEKPFVRHKSIKAITLPNKPSYSTDPNAKAISSQIGTLNDLPETFDVRRHSGIAASPEDPPGSLSPFIDSGVNSRAAEADRNE
jgi:hypothetical protein